MTGDPLTFTPSVTSGSAAALGDLRFSTITPIGEWWPWGTNYWPHVSYGYWYAPPSEPIMCIGKAHVFECEHEPKCKCGAVQRVMSKSKRR